MREKSGRRLIYEAEGEPMKARSVRLNAIQERHAIKLGNGNFSDGVRTAIDNSVRDKEKKD